MVCPRYQSLRLQKWISWFLSCTAQWLSDVGYELLSLVGESLTCLHRQPATSGQHLERKIGNPFSTNLQISLLKSVEIYETWKSKGPFELSLMNLVGTNPRPLNCQTFPWNDVFSQELIIVKKFPTITQCQCRRFIVNLASTLWAPTNWYLGSFENLSVIVLQCKSIQNKIWTQRRCFPNIFIFSITLGQAGLVWEEYEFPDYISGLDKLFLLVSVSVADWFLLFSIYKNMFSVAKCIWDKKVRAFNFTLQLLQNKLKIEMMDKQVRNLQQCVSKLKKWKWKSLGSKWRFSASLGFTVATFGTVCSMCLA